MSSRSLVKKRNAKIIKSLEKQSQCFHNWERYGHGYRCLICEYYSGLDSDLNKQINNEIKQ